MHGWSTVWLLLWYVWYCLFCVPLPSYSQPKTGLAETPPTWLSQTSCPTFTDDLDRATLQQALQRSLTYVQRLPAERMLVLGERQVTASRLRETLEAFQQLLTQAPTLGAVQQKLCTQFEIVQAAGLDGQGNVLFTSYYEMVLEGSPIPTAEFIYPLYTRPPDLIEINLEAFHPRFRGEKLAARYEQGQVLPYFTRHEIDVEGKLQARGLELLWLRDAVDRFFLHIQGSGQIQLPNGHIRRVNYAASNGHPYQSIGRFLIEERRIAREELSLPTLRQYFRDHPEERARVLSYNPRYVFFREVEQGPQGALGLILVPGRSIATDPRLFPPAGLAFIQTQQPVLNSQNEVQSWQPLTRFVLNQDTGGAITGPGRVDLFWGSGPRAEAAAGRIKHEGKLFFLLKRQDERKDYATPTR
jgi:membrane-bound lytic murein transglycosylase A